MVYLCIRVITSNFDPVSCSSATPVIHYIKDGIPICQAGRLLQTCNRGTKVSPILSTPDVIFHPLSMDKTQETDLHHMNEVITYTSFQNSHLNHLIRNVFNCNGAVICSPENSLDPDYNLELVRSTNSHSSPCLIGKPGP